MKRREHERGGGKEKGGEQGREARVRQRGREEGLRERGREEESEGER